MMKPQSKTDAIKSTSTRHPKNNRLHTIDGVWKIWTRRNMHAIFTHKQYTMNTLKKCLLCESPLLGRSDKKFCDDHCRSQHYQNTHKQDAALIRYINRRLKHNRQLLDTFYQSHKQNTVALQTLVDLGFHPDFHTHTRSMKNGSDMKIYYDYGCLGKDNQYIRIYPLKDSNSLATWYDKISKPH